MKAAAVGEGRLPQHRFGAAPIRQRHRYGGTLRAGLQQQPPAVTTGNGLTQGQAQPQTLWGRRHPQLFQIAVEEVRLLLRGDAQVPAFAEAVDDDFGLVVRCPDGRRETVTSGEVSVRGLMGQYV